MADGADERTVSGPARTPGGGWVPVPDPTTLTTEAVTRATEVFRREIANLREIIETRLAGNDRDRELLWTELRAWPGELEIRLEARRREFSGDLQSVQDLIGQRLDGMDTAIKLAASELDKLYNRTRLECEGRAHGEREYVESQIAALQSELEQRLSGMDQATKLLADNVSTIAADIDKSARGLKEIIDTRLAAMDEATKLLATNVDKVPYAILQEAGNLKAFIMSKIEDVSHVGEEKFRAVEEKFASNALALSAALAAQEKAVAAQNDSNTLAISKSESSTKETIAANLLAAQSGLESLAGQVTDIKDRVIRLESLGVGAAGQRTEQRASTGSLVGITGTVLALIAIAVTIIIATRH